MGENCPQISVPSPTLGFIEVDRYTYISERYEIYYEDRWRNLGYLTCFVVFFFCAGLIAAQVVRPLSR